MTNNTDKNNKSAAETSNDKKASKKPKWSLSAAKMEAASRSQAIIEFKIDGTIITANDNFLQTLGYTLAEVKGRHHRMFVDPNEANSPEYRTFWEQLGRGEFASGEFRRVDKNGNDVWIQASYNPVRNKQGDVVRVIKFAINITDQIEQREESVKLRRIVEDSDAAFMMVNRDFKVTYVNQATTELLNQHANTLRTVWPSFDPNNMVGICIDQFHKDPSHQRKLLSDPKNLPYNTDITIGPLTISLNVTGVYDSKGQYVGNTLEWQDVTAEREQAIRDADFRGQIDAISKSQAVIEFDLDGTIRNANENFLAATGYTLQEIQGKHHSMFVLPEFAKSQEYRSFWQDLGAGKFQSGQYERVGKDGESIWIQASYNPILDVNGDPCKVVKYATDITAAKRMEQEVAEKARQDAEKVTEILDVADKVAQRDYSHELTVSGDDPIGKLGIGLAKFFQDKHATELAEQERADHERKQV